MDPYQWLLNKFNLKRRSAPNSKNIHHYLIFMFFPHLYFTMDNCLPIVLLTFAAIIGSSSAVTVLIVLIFFRIYVRSEEDFNRDKGWDGGELVHFIKIGHHHSLMDKLKGDPSLVHSEYKKKTLLYWCKHYKNYKAHNLILEITKEQANQQLKAS